MTSDYLGVEDILDIHADQIERYGGSHGVRDQAGLESAVARPQSGYYDNLVSEAAALWESLSQNHPFVDGNKRTAFASTHGFLFINGVEITADQDQTYEFIMDAFERQEMNFDTLETWLENNTQERAPASREQEDRREQKVKREAEELPERYRSFLEEDPRQAPEPDRGDDDWER